MAESVELAAQKREGRGTREARRMRQKGLIPGIVYGHKRDNVPVALSAEELHKVLRHHARVVDLKTDGAVEKALIRELQWDHLGKDIIHVDFERVSADERVEVSVRLELRGTAPGVNAGGILDQPLHEIEVECLAVAIPESIRVNVGELQLDAFIHARDLTLPEGVKLLTDPDAVVIHVRPPREEVEEGVAAPAEQAEPEVIRREKGEEEEEEK